MAQSWLSFAVVAVATIRLLSLVLVVLLDGHTVVIAVAVTVTVSVVPLAIVECRAQIAIFSGLQSKRLRFYSSELSDGSDCVYAVCAGLNRIESVGKLS